MANGTLSVNGTSLGNTLTIPASLLPASAREALAERPLPARVGDAVGQLIDAFQKRIKAKDAALGEARAEVQVKSEAVRQAEEAAKSAARRRAYYRAGGAVTGIGLYVGLSAMEGNLEWFRVPLLKMRPSGLIALSALAVSLVPWKNFDENRLMLWAFAGVGSANAFLNPYVCRMSGATKGPLAAGSGVESRVSGNDETASGVIFGR